MAITTKNASELIEEKRGKPKATKRGKYPQRTRPIRRPRRSR